MLIYYNCEQIRDNTRNLAGEVALSLHVGKDNELVVIAL